MALGFEDSSTTIYALTCELAEKQIDDENEFKFLLNNLE